MKNISILGSTGSIGTQTLEVVERDPGKYNIVGLTGNKNIKLLEEQTRRFAPKFVAVVSEDGYKALKQAVADTSTKVLYGVDGMCEIAAYSGNDLVVSSTVGISGLIPTMAAIEAGHDIALANKETLVTAGQIVCDAVQRKNVKLLPVDSEHSAIFQCLQCGHKPTRIILTASGGPFFGKKRTDLKQITPAQALKHPNWSMGKKISIDSATMMNKGLEVIEARWLFDMEPCAIDVVVHRESVIHSMIELSDGSILAQLGNPDMKVPISVALNYPTREKVCGQPFDFRKYKTLSFDEPDNETFQCLSLARRALDLGGTAPCFLNGANEAAVELFLNEKIGFLDIAEVLGVALGRHTVLKNYTMEDVARTDREARKIVYSIVGGCEN